MGPGIGEISHHAEDVCVSLKAKTSYREPFFWNYGLSISSPVLANLPPKRHTGSQGRAGGGARGGGVQENRSRLSSLCSMDSEGNSDADTQPSSTQRRQEGVKRPYES